MAATHTMVSSSSGSGGGGSGDDVRVPAAASSSSSGAAAPSSGSGSILTAMLVAGYQLVAIPKRAAIDIPGEDIWPAMNVASMSKEKVQKDPPPSSSANKDVAKPKQPQASASAAQEPSSSASAAQKPSSSASDSALSSAGQKPSSASASVNQSQSSTAISSAAKAVAEAVVAASLLPNSASKPAPVVPPKSSDVVLEPRIGQVLFSEMIRKIISVNRGKFMNFADVRTKVLDGSWHFLYVNQLRIAHQYVCNSYVSVGMPVPLWLSKPHLKRDIIAAIKRFMTRFTCDIHNRRSTHRPSIPICTCFCLKNEVHETRAAWLARQKEVSEVKRKEAERVRKAMVMKYEGLIKSKEYENSKLPSSLFSFVRNLGFSTANPHSHQLYPLEFILSPAEAQAIHSNATAASSSKDNTLTVVCTLFDERTREVVPMKNSSRIKNFRVNDADARYWQNLFRTLYTSNGSEVTEISQNCQPGTNSVNASTHFRSNSLVLVVDLLRSVPYSEYKLSVTAQKERLQGKYNGWMDHCFVPSLTRELAWEVFPSLSYLKTEIDITFAEAEALASGTALAFAYSCDFETGAIRSPMTIKTQENKKYCKSSTHLCVIDALKKGPNTLIVEQNDVRNRSGTNLIVIFRLAHIIPSAGAVFPYANSKSFEKDDTISSKISRRGIAFSSGNAGHEVTLLHFALTAVHYSQIKSKLSMFVLRSYCPTHRRPEEFSQLQLFVNGQAVACRNTPLKVDISAFVSTGTNSIMILDAPRAYYDQRRRCLTVFHVDEFIQRSASEVREMALEKKLAVQSLESYKVIPDCIGTVSDCSELTWSYMSPNSSCNMEFLIAPDDIKTINDQRYSAPDKLILRYYLRFFCLHCRTFEGTSCDININSSQIRHGSGYYVQGVYSWVNLVRRDVHPLVAKNSIRVTHSLTHAGRQCSWIVSIARTRSLDPSDVSAAIQAVISNSTTVSTASALQANNRVSSESDLMESDVQISLLCPLAMCRIQIPVKGSNCVHPQVFDLKSFLLYSTKRFRSKCPVCSCNIPIGLLRVSEPIKRALASVPSSCEAIIMSPDGSFRDASLPESNPASSLKRAREEEEMDIFVVLDSDGEDQSPDPKRHQGFSVKKEPSSAPAPPSAKPLGSDDNPIVLD